MFSLLRTFQSLGVEGSVDPSQVGAGAAAGADAGTLAGADDNVSRVTHCLCTHPVPRPRSGRSRSTLVSPCAHSPLHPQDYLGVIDKDAPIVMKPEDYLADDDLSANSLHVLDCGLFGKSCNNSFPHMNGGEYYDSSSN